MRLLIDGYNLLHASDLFGEGESRGTLRGSRDALLERIDGRQANPFDRSIDVHVSHLRKKLGGKDRIKTVRGVGYQFVLESE